MERNTGENAFALLHRTSNRIRCLQAKFYQNVGDLRLLRMIAHHYPDGATPSRLAGRMGVALPTVSKKLTALENQQLIERKMSDVDRRQTFIFVTEKGCPSSIFPFEITYTKPVPKKKEKEKVVIRKKSAEAKKESSTPRLEI